MPTKPTQEIYTETCTPIDVMRRLLQREAAWLLGCSARTVRAWKVPRSVDGLYDGQKVLRWAVERERTSIEDTLAADGSSPALERYREARAGLAELDFQERQKTLVDQELMRDALGRISAILRRAADTMTRRCGPEAGEIFNDALDDCQRHLDTFFGSLTGDNEPE